MPELPEVEVLVRHLAPLVKNKTVRDITILRPRAIAPTSENELRQTLRNAVFTGLTRRGKYLLFTLRSKRSDKPLTLIGHLGMTGRMYLLPKKAAPPKHAAVVLELEAHNFIYEDTRGFGRLNLDTRGIDKLGPEALGPEFTTNYLAAALKKSSQNIKTKLLDQTFVAGVGNIYASEALFRAKISPRKAANKLTAQQITRLHDAVRAVLEKAIRLGSKMTLDFAGDTASDGLFYFGSAAEEAAFDRERFLVYDRAGQPCPVCKTPIKRLVQGARSTFYCPHCQSG